MASLTTAEMHNPATTSYPTSQKSLPGTLLESEKAPFSIAPSKHFTSHRLVLSDMFIYEPLTAAQKWIFLTILNQCHLNVREDGRGLVFPMEMQILAMRRVIHRTAAAAAAGRREEYSLRSTPGLLNLNLCLHKTPDVSFTHPSLRSTDD